MLSGEQVEVYVSNISNNATQAEIKQYLQIAGPIKSIKLNLDGQKFSANVVFYHWQSAESAKKNLNDKHFLQRPLKISVDLKKYQQTQEEKLMKEILGLKYQQKKQLLSYLKNLKKAESKMFELFLQKNPKLVSSLLCLKN